MTLDEFNGSIRAAGQFLAAREMIEAEIFRVSLPRLPEFNKVALTADSYRTIYEEGLRLSHYNYLLIDYSFFQFSFLKSSEWALAYYPNPRVTGSIPASVFFNELKGARDEGSITDDEFSDLAGEMAIEGFVPRFRFEYSESQYRPVRHPSAHFHIGMSGEDRWCSARLISPLSFAMLITRFYHPIHWWKHSQFENATVSSEVDATDSNCVDVQFVKSLQNDGSSHHITAFERLTLHLTGLQGG